MPENIVIEIKTTKEAQALQRALETCFKNEGLFAQDELKALEKVYDQLMGL